MRDRTDKKCYEFIHCIIAEKQQISFQASLHSNNFSISSVSDAEIIYIRYTSTLPKWFVMQ